jgi:hypothetical protein
MGRLAGEEGRCQRWLWPCRAGRRGRERGTPVTGVTSRAMPAAGTGRAPQPPCTCPSSGLAGAGEEGPIVAGARPWVVLGPRRLSPTQGRGRGQRRTALAREGSRWVGQKTAGEGPDRSANRRTRFACSPNPTANGLTGVVA